MARHRKTRPSRHKKTLYTSKLQPVYIFRLDMSADGLKNGEMFAYATIKTGKNLATSLILDEINVEAIFVLTPSWLKADNL